jgi:hypothetical protein
MADIQRSKAANAAMKSIQGLGKSIGQPVSAAQSQAYKSAVGPGAGAAAVNGGGIIMVLLYIGAGVFAVLLLLMAVDQWVTPVFQTSPGSSGFILVPGTDTTQVYWKDTKSIQDILIGAPPVNPTVPGEAVPLYTTIIEEQSTYSFTVDVLIENEFPQDIGDQPMRTFFILGTTLSKPTISMGLDNSKNTVYITSVDTDGHIQTIVIDNVPIHKPFRIGFTKSQYVMEGYFNGKLYKTIRLRTQSIKPTTGSKIYAPSNIMYGTGPNTKSLSKGIRVMNLRLFGYVTPSQEMTARMTDLTKVATFNPEYKPSSMISSFTSYVGLDK